VNLLIAPNAPSVVQSDAVSLAKPGEMSTEVVVIGTGAGGAAAGAELARAGRKVLFLEAGGAFAQPDFQSKRLSWSTQHLYAGHGPQSTVGDAIMVIPQGRVVGGSTVLNEGICFRPPDHRLAEWSTITGAAHLSPDAMRPFVDDVWRRLGVMATHEGIGRRNNALLRDGLARLSTSTKAQHGWIDRNAPTCLGCGVCHLGCPSGAKASVDKALLPEAANNGARILARARAEGIIVEGGRVTGVDVVVVDPATDEARGSLRIKADLVIVAGSATGSPLILSKSGVGGAHNGHHLSLHPGIGVLAEFDEKVASWNGVPQGYWGHLPDSEPHHEDITIEANGLPPVELYGLLGRAGMPEDARRYVHLTLAGAMIRDEGGGTIEMGEASTFRPKISVRLHDVDMEKFKAGGRYLTRAWFAAGAKRVAPFSTPFKFHDTEASALASIDAMRSPKDMLQVHASHPMGTCRMGPKDGPHAGVVDVNGQVHGTSGLYVMDGSIFPTTLGVNPQITIMSIAQMLAHRLVA
jgi:choline dehydrogenase-like flavoprotein